MKQPNVANGHPVFPSGLLKLIPCIFVFSSTALHLWLANLIDLFLTQLFFIIEERVVPLCHEGFNHLAEILRPLCLTRYVENVLTTLKTK